MRVSSLRIRLMMLILIPLMVIAIAVALWQLNNARRTATEVFDRSMLSAALAVASDVAVSEGDALSPKTTDMLKSTSGAPVFYHVYAPDGVIVAGYATPPVGIPRNTAEPSQPIYFSGTYMGRLVSGVRLQTRTEIDGFAGIFTTTVWQDDNVRGQFVRDLVLRSLITISALVLSVALIVWFGVRFGLRPLHDLENAIAMRSGADLSPIKRAVPQEVEGVVQTLNRLFDQVERTMTAQSEFIGNAAHQLRNPIAGVLSLAEAVVGSKSLEASKKRAEDLLDAARETSDLTGKLLMLERAEAMMPQGTFETLDLYQELPMWVDAARRNLSDDIDVKVSLIPGSLVLSADPVMLREAVINLIDNAGRHGGGDPSRIEIRAENTGDKISLSVMDNGRGMPRQDVARALQRFAGVHDTSGSGLGLAMVKAIALGHGGTLEIDVDKPGLQATLRLPQPPNVQR